VTPSILCHNGVGWHEIWRLAEETFDGDYIPIMTTGGQISDMMVQVIPGRLVDRLWFNVSNTIHYLPIALNPRQESNDNDIVEKLDIGSPYTFLTGSWIETSWITAGLPDINKFWKSVILQSESLSFGYHMTVSLAFRVDDDDDSWNTAGTFTISPSQEINLSATNNVSGKRIKFKLTLNTSDEYKSPRIIALVIKAIVRMPVKQSWLLTFISNPKVGLDKKPLGDDQGDLLSQLETWADSEDHATPLTMNANHSFYNGKTVFIDPASIQLLSSKPTRNAQSKEREYNQVCKMTVYEI
jgi:hypothetical protein